MRALLVFFAFLVGCGSVNVWQEDDVADSENQDVADVTTSEDADLDVAVSGDDAEIDVGADEIGSADDFEGLPDSLDAPADVLDVTEGSGDGSSDAIEDAGPEYRDGWICLPCREHTDCPGGVEWDGSTMYGSSVFCWRGFWRRLTVGVCIPLANRHSDYTCPSDMISYNPCDAYTVNMGNFCYDRLFVPGDYTTRSEICGIRCES